MQRVLLATMLLAAAALLVPSDAADARGNGAAARRGPAVAMPAGSVFGSRAVRPAIVRTPGVMSSRPTRSATRAATRRTASGPRRAAGNTFASRPRNPAPRVIVVAQRNTGTVVNGLPYPVGEGPGDNSTTTLPNGQINGWQFFADNDSRGSF